MAPQPTMQRRPVVLRVLFSYVLVLCSLRGAWAWVSSPRTATTRRAITAKRSLQASDPENHDRPKEAEHNESLSSLWLSSRRSLLLQGPLVASLSTSLLLSNGIPQVASAADVTTAPTTSTTNTNTLTNLLASLRKVPSFLLVNSQGIPYMAVQRKERLAKGYAFTALEGAVVVLSDAQNAANQNGYGDVWKDATICTLPMDVAMRLVLKKRTRTCINRDNQPTLDSLVEIIPTQGSRDDALAIDRSSYMEQGNTPLFYYNQLTTTTNNGETPLYFSKPQLQQAWKQQFPDLNPPKAQVIELSYIFRAVVLGRQEVLPPNIRFVADPEQVQNANKLESSGLGGAQFYNSDLMIV